MERRDSNQIYYGPELKLLGYTQAIEAQNFEWAKVKKKVCGPAKPNLSLYPLEKTYRLDSSPLFVEITQVSCLTNSLCCFWGK